MNGFNRRRFLKGTLSSLALPAMAPIQSVLANTSSGDQLRTASGKLARLVVLFFPNGVALPPENHDLFQDWHWFPHESGKDYKLTNSLLPLAPYRENMSILGGLSHPSHRGMVPHGTSAQYLTGADLSHGYTNSMSIDQVFASALEGITRFPSLVMSTRGGIGSPGRSATLSFDRDGAHIPSIASPTEIYNRLFGLNPQSIAEQKQNLLRDKSILDHSAAEISMVQKALSSGKSEVFERYLSSTRSLEKRLVKSESWLDVPKPNVPSEYFDFDAEPARETGAEFVNTMLDFVYHSLLTDSSRVVTYQMAAEGGSGRGNNLSYAANLADGAHRLTHATAEPNGWLNWAKFDVFWSQRFAHFLDSMQNAPDPLAEGSLLDNTIVLYGSGTSKTHQAYNYPTIVAGGKNLGLSHGAYHRFDQERPFNDLLLTILQQLGMEIESFGDSESTITELLG